MRRTLAVVLLTAGTIPLRVVATSAQGLLSNDQALLLMRLVIATEEARATKDGYGSLMDVVQSPEWPDASHRERVGLPPMDVLDSSSARIGNYLMRITASDDKKHFQVSLEPADSRTCGPALFGDDREIIYLGTALGCPARGPWQ